MKKLTNNLQVSLLYSFSDKYIGLGLRLLSSMILARLLTPSEIGLFSVSFILVMLAHGIRDFGISQYVIQQKELTHLQLRMAFTLGFCLSFLIWGCLYLCSAWIASFFAELSMQHTIQTLSWLFLLVPFGAIRIALLKRHMNFKAITTINVFSYLSLHVSCIILAWFGWGVSALVWGNIIGILATVIGAQWYTREIPLFYPTLAGLRSLLNFGVKVSASQIIENISEGIPEILIGKHLGMMNAGFFSRAQSCVNLFKTTVTQGITPVTLPYFSAQHREGNSLGGEYLKWLSRYSLVAWPFFISLSLLADPVVLILFGKSWQESIMLVKILCWAALIESCLPFHQSMMVATEKINFYFNYQCLHAIVRLLILMMSISGGIQTLCIGLVISEAITTSVLVHRFSHAFDFKVIQWIKALLPGIIVALFIAIGLKTLFCFGLSVQSSWMQLLISMEVGLCLWSLITVCLRYFTMCYHA
jgi:O-antigen/teichoic acid export membrane protein